MGLLATEAASGLSKIVTAEMLNGVLTEITSLLPVCIPVMVGFIAIRSEANNIHKHFFTFIKPPFHDK